jgi:hypothetical protein
MCRLNSGGLLSDQGRMAGPCEHGNRSSGLIKFGVLLLKVRDQRSQSSRICCRVVSYK